MNRILYVHKIHTEFESMRGEREPEYGCKDYKSRRECIDAPRANINFKWVSFRLFSLVTLDGIHVQKRSWNYLMRNHIRFFIQSLTHQIFSTTHTHTQKHSDRHIPSIRFGFIINAELCCVKIFCANENGKYATYYTFKCGHIAIGAYTVETQRFR